MVDEKATLKLLQTIPNIGPSMARDLLSLGYTGPDQLKGEDPMTIYRRLEAHTGSKQDPCVLDTFMAAVHYAETGEKRTWWSFTPERKSLLSKTTEHAD